MKFIKDIFSGNEKRLISISMLSVEEIADNGIEGIFRTLIKNTDVNYQDSKGRTPLMYAVMNNNISIVRILLENNANINLIDKEGFSAITYASVLLFDNGDSRILKLLEEYGANIKEFINLYTKSNNNLIREDIIDIELDTLLGEYNKKYLQVSNKMKMYISNEFKDYLDNNLENELFRKLAITGYAVRCAESEYVQNKKALIINRDIQSCISKTLSKKSTLIELTNYLDRHEQISLGGEVKKFTYLEFDKLKVIFDTYINDLLEKILSEENIHDDMKDAFFELGFRNSAFGYCFKIGEDILEQEKIYKKPKNFMVKGVT